MDFKTVDVKNAIEKGLEVTITYPATGEDTDVKVTVLGVGCSKWKAAQKKIDALKTRALRTNRPLDEDELDELHIEALADVTLGWENVEEDGEQIPFTRENAIRMYSLYPVLSNQVMAGVFNVTDRLEKN